MLTFTPLTDYEFLSDIIVAIACRKVEERPLSLVMEGNRNTYLLNYTDKTTFPFIKTPPLRSRQETIHVWDGLGLIDFFMIYWKLLELCRRTML